jgi:tetratricopeptide (TPR) repeat protein
MQALLRNAKLIGIRHLRLYLSLITIIAFAWQLSGTARAAGSEGLKVIPDSLVSEGNEHYLNREYDLAVKYYTRVIEMGYESAELYYNLGNAFYKLENLSNAILNYEKALLLKPGDEDIRQNLLLANARIIDKIDNIPDFFISRWANSVMDLFSPDQWAYLALILFVLTLALFLAYALVNHDGIRRMVFITGVLVGVLTGLSMLAMKGRTKRLLQSESAIIMVTSVNAKSSPDEQSTNIFVLHEGTKVVLVDSVLNWKEIRIGDGNKGWVPDEVLGEI